jgi:hypothetical protein
MGFQMFYDGRRTLLDFQSRSLTRLGIFLLSCENVCVNDVSCENLKKEQLFAFCLRLVLIIKTHKTKHREKNHVNFLPNLHFVDNNNVEFSCQHE